MEILLYLSGFLVGLVVGYTLALLTWPSTPPKKE